MKRRHWLVVGALATTTGAVGAWAAGPAPSQPAPAQAGVILSVVGEVVQPLALGRNDLLAWPRQTYNEDRRVGQGGKEVTLAVQYQGVPLRELIERAGLKPDRRAVRRAVVLLTARDGYQASYSWGELFNSPLGDGVVVVLRQGNDELLDTDGLPALRSLQDLRPGPRHVRWLQRVEVILPVATAP